MQNVEHTLLLANPEYLIELMFLKLLASEEKVAPPNLEPFLTMKALLVCLRRIQVRSADIVMTAKVKERKRETAGGFEVVEGR
jgi:hypothetical protein